MYKNIYKFIFYLMFFASFESKGQIMFVDNFENGQWASWENTAQWDISSQSPIAGAYSLHHNVTGIRSSSHTSRKILATGFNNGLITWNFKLRNGNWIFGATEQLCFYLIADKSEVSSSNGYAIGVNLTGGDNVLKLCRMENGKAVQDIVVTDLVWKAGMQLEVEVSHEFGQWSVRYKADSLADWSSALTGKEKSMNFSFSNIGVLYKFNTAHGGQIWIDDVSMAFQNRAPSVYEVRSIGRNEMLILFSEPISPISLLNADNYKIKLADGTSVNVVSIRKAAGDTAGVCLQLGDFNQWNLHLSLSDLTDVEGLPLLGNEVDFTFVPTAGFGDIILNEIMADPSPVVQLPNAEFLELKSTAAFSINLKNWMLEVNGKQKILSEKTLAPDCYLILSGTGGSAIWESYGANMEMTGLSLANDGVILKLYSDTKVLIDSFVYKPAMQRDGCSDGGYSLERIDPLRSCGAEANWETSIADKGGTPGIQNSVFGNNQDHTPPSVVSVMVANPSLLEVVVSENPDKIAASGTIFTYSPVLPAPDSILFDHQNLKYSIYFPKGVIKNGVDYDLIINGLADACGNKSPVEHHAFWYYLPQTGDLLINEVLFNPFPGGVDFVEIYNHSGRKVELSEIYLASRDNTGEIKSFYPLAANSVILQDAQYAAFTSDASVLLANYNSGCPDCIYQMAKFPAYNLDEGWVVLMNKEMEIIDEFHYIESMHHPMITDVKGISLERNSFSTPTTDASNWHSASKTVGFATPGYVNSTTDNISETAELVILEPKVFSPNDDDVNDRLLIKLSPGELGWMVNIRIFTEDGIEIRRLANNLTIGSQDVVEWDGTTAHHQKANLGIYIVTVEFFGLQGRKKPFKAACVLTDRLE